MTNLIACSGGRANFLDGKPGQRFTLIHLDTTPNRTRWRTVVRGKTYIATTYPNSSLLHLENEQGRVIGQHATHLRRAIERGIDAYNREWLNGQFGKMPTKAQVDGADSMWGVV